MSLDQHTTLLIKISAAVATSSLAALRAAVTDAKDAGISNEEIQQTMNVAQEIQGESQSHTKHLMNQLLREPKTSTTKHSHAHNDHAHGSNCSCGCKH